MYSAGCNELIRSNRAVLLQSAEELIKAMNWDSEVQAPAVIQRQLFPELDENEEKIVSLLQKAPRRNPNKHTCCRKQYRHQPNDGHFI